MSSMREEDLEFELYPLERAVLELVASSHSGMTERKIANELKFPLLALKVLLRQLCNRSVLREDNGQFAISSEFEHYLAKVFQDNPLRSLQAEISELLKLVLINASQNKTKSQFRLTTYWMDENEKFFIQSRISEIEKELKKIEKEQAKRSWRGLPLREKTFFQFGYANYGELIDTEISSLRG